MILAHIADCSPEVRRQKRKKRRERLARERRKALKASRSPRQKEQREKKAPLTRGEVLRLLAHPFSHAHAAWSSIPTKPSESEACALPIGRLSHTYCRERFEDREKKLSRILVADNIKEYFSREYGRTHFIHHFGGIHPDAHLELQFLDEEERRVESLPRNIVFLRYEILKKDATGAPVPCPFNYQPFASSQALTSRSWNCGLPETIARLLGESPRTTFGLFIQENIFKASETILPQLPEGTHHFWFDFCGSLKPKLLRQIESLLKLLEDCPQRQRGFAAATFYNVARGSQGKHRHTKPTLIPLKYCSPAEAQKTKTQLLNPIKTALFHTPQFQESHRRWVPRLRTLAPSVSNSRVLTAYRNGRSQMVAISLDPKGAKKPITLPKLICSLSS
jgi:hypothetical protein